MSIRGLSIVLLCAGLSGAGAQAQTQVQTLAQAGPVPASPQVLAFEQFIRASAPVCERRPAADCVDAGWGFADTNGDGRLSLAELTEVRDALADWTGWRGDSLNKRERNSIVIGLWLVDSIGLERLLASYNRDADDKLSRDELLADVTLDERPLGEVLLDPQAVDRQAVAQRLGTLSPVLQGLLKKPQ
jgi:hypothetical protein